MSVKLTSKHSSGVATFVGVFKLGSIIFSWQVGSSSSSSRSSFSGLAEACHPSCQRQVSRACLCISGEQRCIFCIQSKAHGNSKLFNTIVEVPARLNLKSWQLCSCQNFAAAGAERRLDGNCKHNDLSPEAGPSFAQRCCGKDRDRSLCFYRGWIPFGDHPIKLELCFVSLLDGSALQTSWTDAGKFFNANLHACENSGLQPLAASLANANPTRWGPSLSGDADE